MLKAFSRKGVMLIVAVLALFGLAFLAIPYIASTQIVRNTIEQELTALTGYRVRLDRAPEITRLYPMRAILSDVRLLDWNQTEPQQILEADQAVVEISALAALRGRVEIQRLRLVRPVLYLTLEQIEASEPESKAELRSMPESWGRLARAIQNAKANLGNSSEPIDNSLLPSEAIGRFEFTDARIVAEEDGVATEMVSGLTGVLDWPALNKAAKLNANGIWRGENVALSLSTPSPLILLAGGEAPIQASVKAAPVIAEYNGTATISPDGRMSGAITLELPSLRRTAEWLRGNPLMGGRVGAVNMKAQLTADQRIIRLDVGELVIDDNKARGHLDLSWPGDVPALNGTLAFDTFNLRSFSLLLNAPTRSAAKGTSIRLFPIAEAVDLDMRLSATTVSYGDIALKNVAAVARATRQMSTLDISDATLFGGALQATAKIDRNQEPAIVDIRANLQNAASQTIAETAKIAGFTAQGPVSISLALKGTGRDPQDVLAHTEGEVAVNFGPGALPGIDYSTLNTKPELGEFYGLSALLKGSKTWDTIVAKANVRGGIAQLVDAEASSAQERITLSGLVNIPGQALALFATHDEISKDENEPAQKSYFFIGGSWDAPMVTSTTAPIPAPAGLQ